MRTSKIPEGIIRFAHALVENAPLRSWFLSLESLPASLRRSAFTQMAEQMRSGKKDAELAKAISALVQPELYAAVRKSVRERCGL